jgi:hypothetical protein
MIGANPSVDEALRQVLHHIEIGCKRIDQNRTISDEARDLFKRRYTLTFVLRLKERDWELDSPQIFKAAEAHGMIAAIIAPYDLSNPANTVNPLPFMKAAHMMEIECRYFLDEFAKQKAALVPLGAWCW